MDCSLVQPDKSTELLRTNTTLPVLGSEPVSTHWARRVKSNSASDSRSRQTRCTALLTRSWSTSTMPETRFLRRSKNVALLLYCVPSFLTPSVWQSSDRPMPVALLLSPRVPRANSPQCLSFLPFLPIALKHRERQRGCALRHGGLLLRYRA